MQVSERAKCFLLGAANGVLALWSHHLANADATNDGWLWIGFVLLAVCFVMIGVGVKKCTTQESWNLGACTWARDTLLAETIENLHVICVPK